MGFAAALEGGWCLGIFVQGGDGAFYFGAVGVEGFGAGGFWCGIGGVAGGEVALGFGHGFGIAEGHACGSAQDAADGPGGIFAREEDFADALFFRAVVPAAQQREVVGEGGEVGWGAGLSFERGDEVGGAEFGAEGGSGCGGG